MGNIAIFLYSIVFLSVSCTAIYRVGVDEDVFLRCLSRQSARPGDILQNVYTRNSSKYISVLESASQNPRWFNETDERPYLIVVPVEETDVWTVVSCSKVHQIQIRVKSGGHDYEGLSVRSEYPFVMIDLSNLNSISVNLTEETVWVQAGATLGQLYYEIANKSKTHAVPAGLCKGLGLGGHVSGGGLGTLMRKYGLAADNAIDARFMDVDGYFYDRNAMGEDTFWALRGGGGASFGVVLAWKLKLVRVPEQVTVFNFRRRLDLGNLRLLHKWQKTAYKLPEDLFIRVLIQKVGDGRGNASIVQVTYNGMFLGPAAGLVQLLREKFPEFGLETEDCFRAPAGNGNCTSMPCIMKECYQVSWIQSAVFFSGGKTDQPVETLLSKFKNTRFFNKGTSDFLEAPIPDQGWKMIRQMFLSEDSPIMIIDPLGGRMDKIPEYVIPFPHRKGNLFNIQYLINWSGDNSAQVAEKHLAFKRSLHEKMTPYVAKWPRTAYFNYKDLDLGRNDYHCNYTVAKVWGEKYFKGNFEKLAKIKAGIDPLNFFRSELSIPVLK
ncbi:cannabidiolic acid synthase-like 2-like [Dorcoceras hygrometricum]|uniref:Cannabidiolic acid synthase-like 2-like n=1 Tax=Dorcoceras hygrometricum TaxID=472368 RepID=A0A2Z7CW68_9LAMI|nr:cannabidiolic acid synthase-like 2-like [Dorcoceras hygrometricum]